MATEESTMNPEPAVIDLPAELVVAADALGSTIKTTIEPFSVAINFPTRISDAQLGPPPGAASLSTHEPAWGHRMNSSWAVTKVALAIEPTPGDQPDFVRKFAAWFAIVREWVYAKNRIPLAFSSGRAMRFQIGSHGGIMMPTSHLVSGVAGPPAVELQSACDRAARNERPALQHRLLLSAFSSLIVADYRRAVIDAGTAAEVALGTLIDGALRSKSVAADAIDRIVVQANGAVGLYSLATKLGWSCSAVSKNRLANELAERRNKVAHAGADVSNKEAATAVGCARELVASATPLDFP
jgi:hypothetical protein